MSIALPVPALDSRLVLRYQYYDMSFRNTIVQAENLAAGFGDRLLFRELTFTLNRGDFVLVRGENGCGKTTLAKIILGLTRPRGGRICVMGEEVGTARWRRVRRLVAYMTQHPVASDFPISALEVALIGTSCLRLDRREKTALARRALASTNCLHLAGAPYAVLSGGEKQRVSLARCLAQQPRLLVLDEPASHLDGRSKTELSDILLRLNREEGLTVFLVSHEHHDPLPSSARARQVRFENGRVSLDREALPRHEHGEAP